MLRSILLTLGMALAVAAGVVSPDVNAQTKPRAAAEARRPPKAAVPERVKRTVLALYDGREEATPAVTRIHQLLELPLNHLGYRVAYWDVATGLPPAAALDGVHAFATWFARPLPEASAYFGWARTVVAGGVKAVVLENPGGEGDAASLPAINGFLRVLGLEYADYYVSDTASTTVAVQDALVGFERKLEPALLAHQVVKVASPAVRVHLALADPAHRWTKTTRAAQIATGPNGGFVAPGFAVRYENNRRAWIVDPFAFLAAALGTDRFPVPDTTTMVGRRIYFSHIDGDSWNGTPDPREPRNAGLSSAEVVLRDLIGPYPDLPVAVGLITSDIDPDHGGDARAAEQARRIFALPQVETASHTHTHPFAWQTLDPYDRTSELRQLLRFAASNPAVSAASPVVADRSLARVVEAAKRQGVVPLQAYDGVYDLPRAKVHQPFSIAAEVAESLTIATRLAPPQKPARLYLWSGNTSPSEAVIRATRQAGVRNMNGGDGRYDSDFPSVSYLPAIGKPVGAERQIYAGASNEYTYTNDWKGPYDGFAKLAETLANTETPRRLKPFNVYYHMYSAVYREATEAVRRNLELARASALTPVAASTYAAIADAFYDVEITRIAHDTWRIDKRGALQTVRFDGAAARRVVDYARSTGVLGHRLHNGSLYVALDPANDAPVVALAERAVAQGKASSVGARAYLVESRWPMSDVRFEPCRIAGRVQGFGAGTVVFDGVVAGRYAAHTTIDGRDDVASASIDVGADGRLAVTLPGNSIGGGTFQITCRR